MNYKNHIFLPHNSSKRPTHCGVQSSAHDSGAYPLYQLDLVVEQINAIYLFNNYLTKIVIKTNHEKVFRV